ncbi:MAG: helix-turn-helix protein [Cyanobacteria bacterium RYN_339]|nr:helix-turn-helix protein [Cyanobacteria bacterium RYN_339]
MPEWRKQTDSERKRLAARLREAREAAGLNQHEVAVQLGIGSRSIISELEHGQRRLDVVELMALAVIYGKPAAWFLDGDGAGFKA